MRPITFAAAMLLLAGCSSEAAVTTGVPETTTTVAVPTTTGAPATTMADSTTTTALETTTTTEAGFTGLSISYAGGEVIGGGRIEIPLGEPVQLTIISDVADEGHLHGYDIFVDLEPGTPSVMEFTADIPGIFELELEDARVLLADLEVAP